MILKLEKLRRSMGRPRGCWGLARRAWRTHVAGRRSRHRTARR